MNSLPMWASSIAAGVAAGAPIWIFIFKQRVDTLRERLLHLESISAPELARQVREISVSLDETTGRFLALKDKLEESEKDAGNRDTKSFKEGLLYGVASTVGEFVRLVKWADYQTKREQGLTVSQLRDTLLETLMRFLDRTIDPLTAGQEPSLPSLDLKQPVKPWNQ